MTSRYRALIRSRSFESVLDWQFELCSNAIRMPKERPKSRKERRQLKKANYLSGQARDPYLHSPTLGAEQEPSDTGAGTSSGTSVLPTPTSGVCPRCLPVLSKYQATFKELTHRGSSLKRVKHVNPNPTSPNIVHYRDVKRQNEWLRENVFDPMGNYLFCSRCVCKAFHISDNRLTRQRNVKRSASNLPIVDMKKSDAVAQKLGDFVVMPQGNDQSFLVWWRSLPDDHIIQVRYPYEHHGNARKESHSAKPSVRDDFLKFVDCNIQPNGRSANSSGPTHYFVCVLFYHHSGS